MTIEEIQQEISLLPTGYISTKNIRGKVDDSCNIRTTFLKHADKIPETFGQDS